MTEQFSGTAVAVAIGKGLATFALAMGTLSIMFWLFQPVYRMPPIAVNGGETTLLVEGAKELDSIIAMLITLTTDHFVLVALVARTPLRPNVRVSPDQFVLFGIFGLSASGSFYAGFHAKYIVAEGLQAKSINLPLIQGQIAT